MGKNKTESKKSFIGFTLNMEKQIIKYGFYGFLVGVGLFSIIILSEGWGHESMGTYVFLYSVTPCTILGICFQRTLLLL